MKLAWAVPSTSPRSPGPQMATRLRGPSLSPPVWQRNGRAGEGRSRASQLRTGIKVASLSATCTGSPSWAEVSGRLRKGSRGSLKQQGPHRSGMVSIGQGRCRAWAQAIAGNRWQSPARITLPLTGRQGAWGGEAENPRWPLHSRGAVPSVAFTQTTSAGLRINCGVHHSCGLSKGIVCLP